MTAIDLCRDAELQEVPDAEQIAAFCSVLADAGDVLEIRTKGVAVGGVQQTWHYARDIAAEASRLRRLNHDRHIYISANPRRDFGLGGDVNVAQAHCLFVDCDQANGFKNVPTFLELVEATGLPEPTAVVFSGHGAWCFWRLAEPMLDMVRWKATQRRLITLLQTDSSAANPERMTRLPGFWNHKEPKAMAWLWSVNPERHYGLDTIEAVLPPLAPVVKTITPINSSNSAPNALQRARAYAARVEIPVESNRNTTLFRAAGHLWAFGVGEADVLALITGVNNLCRPPLPENELRTLVRSAMTNGTPREAKHDRPLNHRQIALRGRDVCHV